LNVRGSQNPHIDSAGFLPAYLTSEEERRASQLLLLMLAGHRNVGAPWQVEFLL
jgi:hypothetical protein